MTALATARAILEEARWAPSGDNSQPWRFEILSGDHVVVHGFDTREHCVYDLDGHSSQLAIGALLETMRIAATAHGLRASAVRRGGTPESRPMFDVRFAADPLLRPSPLAPCIRVRAVQRRALRMRSLASTEKAELEASVGDGYRVEWKEGLVNRWRAARLMWRNAGLRLTIPEAYEVHRRIIEWGARFSDDKIPEQALGVNPLTARLMRFAMKSWARVEFLNKWLGGTLAPRFELELVPSLACAAHFALVAERPCSRPDDYVSAGAAVQRFWLTACALGLQLQPEMTPLIFSRYATAGRRFSRVAGAQRSAQEIAEGVAVLFGTQAAARAVFMGRVGAGRPATARSLRLPLETLLVHGAVP
jgi:nitroreductase